MRKMIFWMLATILFGGLMLPSCTNDDNPVGLERQKRVSNVTCYIEDGEGFLKFTSDNYKYDAQGRIAEIEHFVYDEDDTGFLSQLMTFSYSVSQINMILKVFSRAADAETVIIDKDLDIDENGRVVKEITYSYSETESRQDATICTSLFTYDEQGHLVRSEYSNGQVNVYEWQNGELSKNINNQDGELFQVLEYEPSEVPADMMLPINFDDMYECLEMEGFFGQRSRFLPARIKQTANMVVYDQNFTYEMTDGLVTTWYKTASYLIPVLGVNEIVVFKNTVEWE